MAWHKLELCCTLIAVLMMTSSIFCLEILPKGKLIQSGRLVIGSIKTEDDVPKKMDEHLGDMNGYQADQPTLMDGSRLGVLRLQRLSPSVQCDNDSMSLHVKGSKVPNFMVETSEEGPLPLSQMPSSCGYSVRRARRDLSLSANYDCCNVMQQGNTYILPLRFSGVTVKVVCPVSQPRTTIFCSSSDMVANLPTSLETLRIKVNGVWQPVSQVTACGFTWQSVGDGLTLTAPYLSQCWQIEGAERRLSVQYTSVELTLSCPAVATSVDGPLGAPTATPASDPLAPYQWAPGMYYPYFMPWQFQLGNPTTVAPTTTTSVAPASADGYAYPWLSGVQYPHFGPWNVQHGHSGIPPVTHNAPAGANQQAFSPLFPGWLGHGMPWPFPPEVAAQTTTTPATTVAPSYDQSNLYPWLPGMNNPYVPVAYPDVSMTGPNSGVYQKPWMNAFSNYQQYQQPGFPAVKPSGAVSHPAYLFPLNVKPGPRK